jgi:hypothetical protein
MLDYSKENAVEVLYNAFLEKGERLDAKEIIEKKLFSKNALTQIFGSAKTKTIWEEIDSHYNINTEKTEKQKLELIKEMQDMYKELPVFNNKSVPRYFRNKMERFFGSWVEAMVQSGLKPNCIIPTTLSNERKDLILENLISIVLSENKIPSKTSLSKYKNIPDARMCKVIYGVEWEELVFKLGLDKSRRQEFNKLSNSQVLEMFKNEMKNNKSMSLSEYSLNLTEGSSFPFIYYMERYELNFKYMVLLFKNDFKDVRRNKFYKKEDLLNILTFKYLLNGRQLKAIEIDNDSLIPDVNCIMSVFQKGIYEVWLMAEECSKTYY